jgi:methionyl-tRNA formyltransferase
VIRIAYFGLPLGALLLSRDGVEPGLAVLSPTEAPGRRRLERRLGGRVVDARGFEGSGALESLVDARLAALAPDLIVSWYYTRRLPERWLRLPRLGAIGAHPSLLPRHRGPNPFFAAIDSGDRETGVTVHRLVERYDEGDVLFTERVAIGEMNAWELARALDRPSLRLLRRAVSDIAAGRAPAGTPQDEALSTWAPEPTGDLLRADFRWGTERVLRRIRALSPVPGLALEIRGVELFVTEARATAEFPAALVPGEAAVTGRVVVVRTTDGAVAIRRAVALDPETDEPEEMNAEELAARVGAGRAGDPPLGELD